MPLTLVTSFVNTAFTRIASLIAAAAGQPATFLLALGTVAVWAGTGPLFHFSDTWQLVINTGTTIVTFLMVFLIQNSQNRDAAAMQAKLDEVLRAIRDALERETGNRKTGLKGAKGKGDTPDETVDRLLDRF